MTQEPSREELLARIAELEKLAYYDALTGIMNRRALDDTLVRITTALFRAFKSNRKTGGYLPLMGTDICLVQIDLDKFKSLNDTHPDKHLAGDRALIVFARLLEETFRRPLDVVARQGGDEFMLILPDTTTEQAAARIQVLQGNMLDHSVFVIRGEMRVTTSVGITTLMPGNHPISSNEILLAARERLERLLYDAKETFGHSIRIKAPAICQEPRAA